MHSVGSIVKIIGCDFLRQVGLAAYHVIVSDCSSAKIGPLGKTTVCPPDPSLDTIEVVRQYMIDTELGKRISRSPR